MRLAHFLFYTTTNSTQTKPANPTFSKVTSLHAVGHGLWCLGAPVAFGFAVGQVLLTFNDWVQPGEGDIQIIEPWIPSGRVLSQGALFGFQRGENPETTRRGAS